MVVMIPINDLIQEISAINILIAVSNIVANMFCDCYDCIGIRHYLVDAVQYQILQFIWQWGADIRKSVS